MCTALRLPSAFAENKKLGLNGVFADEAGVELGMTICTGLFVLLMLILPISARTGRAGLDLGNLNW